MIIKSMSRHEPTFSQLVDYMEDGRQDKRFTLKNNLFSHNPEKIKTEFENNACFFKKRKNSVYMYHEVISITKSKQLNDEDQKEILRKIILEYIKKRAKNNLVYAVLHDDKTDNFHYHLLISSNELEESKKHRLSKSKFDKIKKDLEIMVLDKYPELQQEVIINKPAKEKLSNKEYQTKRRTGKISQRDFVKNRLKDIFESSKDKQSFFDNIQKANLEIYVRGKTIGIIDKGTGRKHRLKTLGMLDDFNKISPIVEQAEKINQEVNNRKEQLKENHQEFNKKTSVKNNTYTTEDYIENHLNEAEIEISKRKKELNKSRASLKQKQQSKTKNR
ncbi:MAG: relaxase/mobilization nuclease domain-containing protein [Cellulophaga sp.]